LPEVGLFWLALALPLVQRRIVPNGWYGFRVPRTLNSPERWYAVNAYAGRHLLRGGVAVCFFSCLVFVPGVSTGVFSALMILAVVAGPLISLVLGLRYLRTLP
jgi:hypothetical protein